MLSAVVIIFLACLGACIGSFLNVVIFRLPRGMSVAQPRRSFCPSCGRQIEWYDNIPVLSWIILRGRCRYCQLPISLQYPLVEIAGIVLTMLVWQASRGLCTGWTADTCWPMVAGTLGLFYCLLGLSAMDLEAYYVDIRLTWLALLIGLVCHAISPAGVWPAGYSVSPAWGVFAVGCTVALGVLHWLWPMPELEEQPISGPNEPPLADETTLGQAPSEQQKESPTGNQASGEQSPTGSSSDERSDTNESSGNPLPSEQVPTQEVPAALAADCVPASKPVAPGIQIGLVLLLGIAAAGIVAAEIALGQPRMTRVAAWWPAAAGLAILFVSILAGSWLATEADFAIADAVESERPWAVGQAAREGIILLLSALAGVGLMWLASRPGTFSDAWTSLLAWTPWEGVRPIAGLVTALFGWILAGGLCWLIRVIFTLVLRKEALGFGDIHIIAAVGAVLGPQMAVAGFFLAAPVALLGGVVLIFRKSYRTLPFGPWLSLGFLLALLWGRQLVQHIDAGIAGFRMAMGR